MPGLVIEEPWQDFAYNRTHVMEALRKVERLDYALIIDADDRLVLDACFDPIAFKQGMRQDLSARISPATFTQRSRANLPHVRAVGRQISQLAREQTSSN